MVNEKLIRFVEERLKDERTSGLDHMWRVRRWCEIIGREEDADLEVLRLAAILHDVAVPTVGRQKHFEEGARVAEKLLREVNYPREKIEAVSHAIEAHSRFGGPEPETKEAKILYDADVLDFVGAIGVVRAVARELTTGTYSGRVEDAPAFLKKLVENIGEEIYTEKAREIRDKRMKYLKSFIATLEEELRETQ